MAVWAGTLVTYDFIMRCSKINFVVGAQGSSAAGSVLLCCYFKTVLTFSRLANLRASLGHPEPFALTFVEVGNEDNFAANTYIFRWRDFVNALKAQFPDLHFIATTGTFNPILSPDPTEYDVHVYQIPSWFAQNSFFYDGFERNQTKYFEGEYAAISTNPNDIFGSPADGRLTFPTMQSSTGEAAFMTGLERNSDIVFAASYAPLLNHVANSQWLFSQNRGDEYIPSTLPSRTGTIFWSVVRNTAAQSIIIKISNTIATETPVTFVLPFTTVASTGTLQIQILSDLHLEIERPNGTPGCEFYHYDIPVRAEHLALLGDIGWTIDDRLFEWLEAQLKLFKTVFFQESTERLNAFANKINADPSLGTFVYLNRTRHDVSPELTILGCTLWSSLNPDDLDILSWSLTDFRRIDNFSPDAYDALHKADLAWLNSTVASIARDEPERQIVVLTHHAPTKDGTGDPKFNDGPTNSAFVTELTGEECWESKKIKLWAFGHTHWCCDFNRKGTRVYSNQRGYGEGREDYDAGKIVEL
ncbi:hypothetical protein C0993_005069 [Termitomyces sp. T159_Od127]|nr:hypothetical protein C0993_005069 [Termitomyces sp. T159_Od127]